MMKLIIRLKTFSMSEKGQGMVEYGLIIALVAIVVIGAIMLLGGNITGIFTKAAKAVGTPGASGA